jgi:hypothetical protein
VFDYIERLCNLKRRHSAIDHLSPMELEMQAQLALDDVNETGCRPVHSIGRAAAT